MKFEDAFAFIKNCFEKGKLVESAHFLRRFEERNIKNFKFSEIKGLLEQNENVYKLWFYYKQQKDLNVIVKTEEKNLRLITIFPCERKLR